MLGLFGPACGFAVDPTLTPLTAAEGPVAPTVGAETIVMPPVSPSVTHLPPHPTHNRLVSLLPSLFRGYPTSGIPRHVSLGQLSPSREYPWSSNPDIFDAASSAVELAPKERSGAGPAPGCLLRELPVATGAGSGRAEAVGVGLEDEA